MVEDMLSPPALPRRGIGFHGGGGQPGVAGRRRRVPGLRRRPGDPAAGAGEGGGPDEVAMTLHQAVARLAHHSAGELQEFVDAVCGRMTDDASPWLPHRGRMRGRVYQARAHGPGLRTTRCGPCGRPARTPDRRGVIQREVVVVGTHAEDGTRVFVAERLDTLRHEIRVQLAPGRRRAGIRCDSRLPSTSPSTGWCPAPSGDWGGPSGQFVLGSWARAGTFKSREFAALAAAVNDMGRALAEDDARRRLATAHAAGAGEPAAEAWLGGAGVTIAAVHHPGRRGGRGSSTTPSRCPTGRSSCAWLT